jgi:hypothetical protein
MFPEASGYSFAVFVPFLSFPPLPSLETSELYVLVDVFNAAPAGKKMGAYSTSSPARVWGKPGTFNALRLDPPFSFPLTPCKLPLEQGADEGEKRLTWVLPNLGYSPDELTDTFEVVQNEDEWGGTEPQGRSPDVVTHHHFSRYFPLGPGKDNGVWVCGPNLGIARGGVTKSYSEVISAEVLDLKQMPDGRLLLKVGPEVGTVGQRHGNCGAAPKNDLRIFDLDKDLDLHTAIALGGVICGPLLSQDFTISPDWSQITEYDDNQTDDSSDSWTSTTYCLKSYEESGYNYEPCGTKHNVQPPNPPALKELHQ